MARKFASTDDLRRYALAKGAEVDGFNAGRTKVALERPEPEKAAPPPPPPPPPAPVVVENDMTVRALVQQTATLSQLFDELRAEIRAAAESAQPPTEWVFDVERDDEGFIARIVATMSRPTMN